MREKVKAETFIEHAKRKSYELFLQAVQEHNVIESFRRLQRRHYLDEAIYSFDKQEIDFKEFKRLTSKIFDGINGK